MKRIYLLIIPILMSLILSMNVQAKSVLETGNNLEVGGKYDSSKFIFGNEIDSSAEVDGISLFVGNSVNTSGKSSYGIYIGNILYINDEINKDAFILGNSVNIGSDAILNRDVYIVGENVKINTDIERNLRVTASTLDLRGITIAGSVYTSAENIIMDSDTVIKGKLSYYENATLEGLNDAQIGSVDVKEYEIDENYLLNLLLSALYSIISGFIVLFIIFSLFPKIREKLDNVKVVGTESIKNTFNGILVLFGVPIILLFVMMIRVLFPISIISIAIYLISLYLSTLITSYIVGKRILKKDNYYFSILVGIVLVKLLSLIPYLGIIVSIFALLYGLGIIYRLFKERDKNAI